MTTQSSSRPPATNNLPLPQKIATNSLTNAPLSNAASSTYNTALWPSPSATPTSFQSTNFTSLSPRRPVSSFHGNLAVSGRKVQPSPAVITDNIITNNPSNNMRNYISSIQEFKPSGIVPLSISEGSDAVRQFHSTLSNNVGTSHVIGGTRAFQSSVPAVIIPTSSGTTQQGMCVWGGGGLVVL